MKHIGNLKYAEGSKKKRKRIGRGQGSGHGGTSTRGMNGQKSRAGSQIGPAFEGGQMPMNRRLPKFGFFSRNRVEYQEINIEQLQYLLDHNQISETVDFEILLGLGRISHKEKPLKILGNGELKTALKVKAHKFTASAKEKIEASGGSVETYE
jgi:large subunit ribosomal protein L15